MNQISYTLFPTLSTERTELRQLRADDEEAVLQLRSDASVSKYINRKVYTERQEAADFISLINKNIENRDVFYWAINLKNDPRLIGIFCLWNFSKDCYRAEVGYELLPRMHGQGIMQEVLARVIEYAFKDLHLHSLEANVFPENAASIALLERNGFVREAYFKESVFFNDRFIDTAIYSLLNK